MLTSAAVLVLLALPAQRPTPAQAGEIPVLLAPDEARAAALRSLTDAPRTDIAARLAATEVLLLGRSPREARAALQGLPPIDDPALAARAEALALDIAVAEGDDAAVTRAAEALVRRPGWSTHAQRQALTAEAQRSDRTWALYGSILYSLALAVLMIGGARELLRPRLPTVGVALAAAVAAAGALALSPVLGRVVLLADLALLALAHAAVSTLRRADPSPRGRAFLSALVVVGALGVIIAIVAPLPWAFVLAELGP